ncbi:MAG TPA: lysine--tRNA ligase [Thermoplasmata archaeon]|nr:lysine--tRNA ligase [Thermoplasmata archaeon]
MVEESPLEHERREKIGRLRARGTEPFPWSFPGRVATSVVRAAAARLRPGEEDLAHPLRVAGRLRAIRVHGRTAFADLDDLEGSLQLLLRVDELGERGFADWIADLDPGDLVGADGAPAVSRRGEPSLLVSSLTLLAKAIAPPPEKFHGLQDVEERIRRRYVELLASPESRNRFRLRSLLVAETRRFLADAAFLEVETPVLLPVAGGAAARPFVTRSHYLDEELQLRIALELPLKRLLVGGLERVFEIGKCFRNEDMDTTHSPEFTMLELYWAYADYHDMRGLVERLYTALGRRATEAYPDSREIAEAARAFAAGFSTIDFVDELERRSGIPDLGSKEPAELARLVRAAGSTVPADSPPGVFLDKLFEHYVEPTLTAPTFVVDHPETTTPLAKRHRAKPGRVERFEFYFRGFELGNAYTELNDPDEQERRFRAQLSARGAEQYAFDEDFVRALRYGLPPCTGVGIGVDRMVMALTGTPSIKEVILFPQTRRA